MKIIIVGASGLLGCILVPAIKSAGHNVVTMGRLPTNDFRCDIGDVKSASSLLDMIKPDIIINLVALTDVDLCESDPGQAFSVNVRTTETIVTWIESAVKNCHLVQISTDQVYDGAGPHFEANVALSNYYAFSKYASELAAVRVPSTILRTNFFGKSCCIKRVSFTDWIYDNVISNKKIVVFNDVFFSPLSMETLAQMMLRVIALKPIGIFNLGSHAGLSKSAFALLFLEKLDIVSDNIEVVSINDVSFIKTYRPKDMRMNVTKFEQQLSVRLPTLEDEIIRVSRDYG